MNASAKRPLHNQDIRAAIGRAGLRYWWVAEELGIAGGTLSNRLRRELASEEKLEVLAAVKQLADRLGGSAPESARPEVTLEARATLPGRIRRKKAPKGGMAKPRRLFFSPCIVDAVEKEFNSFSTGGPRVRGAHLRSL